MNTPFERLYPGRQMLSIRHRVFGQGVCTVDTDISSGQLFPKNP